MTGIPVIYLEGKMVTDTKDTDLRKQISQLTDILEAERSEKRTKKNLDFVQVQRSEMRAIAELGSKSPLALDLLMIFAQSMNKQNAIMMSYKAMTHVTNRGDRQLRRAISVLKEDKWIQVIKVGTANAYVLNNAVFWTGHGDQKHLGTFSAQITTTFDEQNKDVRSSPNVELKRVPSIMGKNERVILGEEDLPPPDQKDLDIQ